MAKSKVKTGQERLERFTDKSNEYEQQDITEKEPPNSVFPFEKGNVKNSRKQKK